MLFIVLHENTMEKVRYSQLFFSLHGVSFIFREMVCMLQSVLCMGPERPGRFLNSKFLKKGMVFIEL